MQAAEPPSQSTSWSDWIRHGSALLRDTWGGRVLLISYLFPPTGGSAVQRPAKLAKYLSRLGWSVEVVTAGHDRFPWHDKTLLLDIPDACRIHRVRGWEPASVALRLGRALRIEEMMHWRLNHLYERCGIRDPQALWVGPATRAMLARHRRAPFDAVISTGPPHFTHRVAIRIKERTGTPWIADLRDPLVSDFDRTRATARVRDGMRRLERRILHTADAVLTTCDAFTKDLQDRYPHRENGDIQTVTNGFDRDDLRPLLLEKRSDPANGICVFAAIGSFYGRRELDRIVAPMQSVLDHHPEWQGRVRLIVAGTLDGEQRQRWENGCPGWMELAGYLDHAAALRLAAQSACTIIVVPDCEHGRTSIPGKTFELLALPTHVLALVPPDSETARVVRDTGASTIARFESPDEVGRSFEGIIQAHAKGLLPRSRDWLALDRYDRFSIAAQFAECLGSLTPSRAADDALEQDHKEYASRRTHSGTHDHAGVTS